MIIVFGDEFIVCHDDLIVVLCSARLSWSLLALAFYLLSNIGETKKENHSGKEEKIGDGVTIAITSNET